MSPVPECTVIAGAVESTIRTSPVAVSSMRFVADGTAKGWTRTIAVAPDRGDDGRHIVTQTVTYRVLGLCYPERVDELRAVLKDRPVTIVGIDYARGEATFTHDPKELSAESLGHAVGAKGFGIFPTSHSK